MLFLHPHSAQQTPTWSSWMWLRPCVFLCFFSLASLSFGAVGLAQSIPASMQIKRGAFYVSLFPSRHHAKITATLTLINQKKPWPSKLRTYLPQIIELKTVTRRVGKTWKRVPFKRQLETVLLTLKGASATTLSLRMTYTITFDSKKNYLFRALFCRIDPKETYLLYGWYPALRPFADPLSGRLLKGDRFPYKLDLEVPTGQIGLSSGPLLSGVKVKKGRTRYTYREAPLKEAAIFFLAAPLKRSQIRPDADTQVDFYLRPQDGKENLKQLGRLIIKAQRFYKRWLGAPTGRKNTRRMRWRLVSFGGSGARGYPFTLLLDRQQGYFRSPLHLPVDPLFTRRQVLLHEMAHTWWGNAVTGIGKGSVWINEGLANYSSIRALGALYGARAEAKAIKRHVKDYLRSEGRGGLLDPGGLAQMARRTAYTKGALVFFELERMIGRKKVDAGLRLFFQRSRGGFARVADLQKALEDSAGQSLKAFFRDWVFGASLPFLQLRRWRCTNKTGSGCTLSLKLANLGRVSGYAHIGARGPKAGKPRTRWIKLKANQALEVTWSLPFRPRTVALDPEGVMLHGFRTQAWMERATRLRRAGQLTQATPLFQRILQAHPKHGKALYGFGLLRQKQGKKEAALQLFRRASKKDVTFAPHWLPLWAQFRAASLLQALGKHAQARRLFNALLKQPNNPYGLKQRIHTVFRKQSVTPP